MSGHRKSDVEPGQLPARRVAHVHAHTRVLHIIKQLILSAQFDNRNTQRKGSEQDTSVKLLPAATDESGCSVRIDSARTSEVSEMYSSAVWSLCRKT